MFGLSPGRVLFACVATLILVRPGFGQTASEDWRELRRRLENNLELQSFLAKYSVTKSTGSPGKAANTLQLRESSVSYGMSRGVTTVPPLSLPGPQEAVRRMACEEGVPPDLALAVIEHESDFNNQARGAAGEVGASQILPATSELFEFDRAKLRRDYEYNVQSGVRVMRFLLDELSPEDAIRAYNGGLAFRTSSRKSHEKVELYLNDVLQRRSKYAGIGCR